MERDDAVAMCWTGRARDDDDEGESTVRGDAPVVVSIDAVRADAAADGEMECTEAEAMYG